MDPDSNSLLVLDPQLPGKDLITSSANKITSLAWPRMRRNLAKLSKKDVQLLLVSSQSISDVAWQERRRELVNFTAAAEVVRSLAGR